jgi:hypothetical protein
MKKAIISVILLYLGYCIFAQNSNLDNELDNYFSYIGKKAPGDFEKVYEGDKITFYRKVIESEIGTDAIILVTEKNKVVYIAFGRGNNTSEEAQKWIIQYCEIVTKNGYGAFQELALGTVLKKDRNYIIVNSVIELPNGGFGSQMGFVRDLNMLKYAH